MRTATFRLVLDMALAHLKRRRRQTVISLLGVMLGVGAFIGLAAMMEGFQRDFVNRVIDVAPHVQIRDEFRNPPRQAAELRYPDAAVGIQGLRPRQEIRGIRNPGRIVAALNAQAGVRAAPSLSAEAILRYGSTDVSATIIGIDPELERRVSNLEDDLISDSSLTALRTTANGIILGEGLAEKLGLAMGDTVNVVSPTGLVLRMKVAGLFRTGLVSKDNFESYALLKKVQILEQRPNVINRINLKLDDIDRATPLARTVEGLYGYRAESWEEANAHVLSLFVIDKAILYTTVGAVLVVAGFGIFNIISTVIHEKSRDIAILKSMGFREGDIRNVFVIEGLTVGVAGAALGWVLGYAITELLASIRFEIRTIVALDGFVLYRWIGHYLIGGGLAVLTSVLAAWLPARQAAQFDPVIWLRGGL